MSKIRRYTSMPLPVLVQLTTPPAPDPTPADFQSVMGAANTADFWRTDSGITIGTTPLAGGSSPPAVTWAGTLLRSDVPFIQIDGAGTFKWSLDGGATFQATGVPFTAGGSAVALGSSGLSATFPSGTYNTGHTYSATAASWAGVKGVHTFTMATASRQPLLVYNDLSAKRGLRGNVARTSNLICATLLRSAPGTALTFIRALAKQNTWTLGGRVYGDATSGVDAMNLLQAPSATPQLAIANGTVGAPNSGAAIGSAKRVHALYSNSAGDYLVIGSVTTTGNVGNTAPGGGGMNLFASQGGNCADVTIYEFDVANIAPDVGQIAALDAEATTRWGAGVLT